MGRRLDFIEQLRAGGQSIAQAGQSALQGAQAQQQLMSRIMQQDAANQLQQRLQNVGNQPIERSELGTLASLAGTAGQSGLASKFTGELLERPEDLEKFKQSAIQAFDAKGADAQLISNASNIQQFNSAKQLIQSKRNQERAKREFAITEGRLNREALRRQEGADAGYVFGSFLKPVEDAVKQKVDNLEQLDKNLTLAQDAGDVEAVKRILLTGAAKSIGKDAGNIAVQEASEILPQTAQGSWQKFLNYVRGTSKSTMTPPVREAILKVFRSARSNEAKQIREKKIKTMNRRINVPSIKKRILRDGEAGPTLQTLLDESGAKLYKAPNGDLKVVPLGTELINNTIVPSTQDLQNAIFRIVDPKEREEAQQFLNKGPGPKAKIQFMKQLQGK